MNDSASAAASQQKPQSVATTNPAPVEPDITVVVSCYNEEAFITETLDHVAEALRKVGCSYELIVIDDCSKDGSAKKLRDYVQAHAGESITLKINEINRGWGNIYVEAAFLGKGKYYRLCPGDDTEPVDVMVNVFKRIGAADIIIPYQNQDEVTGKTKGRRILSKIFTFLVNTISGHRIKYYNGMAIHLRYNVLRWHPSSYGFGFQADMITRLLDEGASYAQIRSSSVDRKGSASSALGMRNFLSVAHTLLEISIRRFRRFLYGKSMPDPVEIHLKD